MVIVSRFVAKKIRACEMRFTILLVLAVLLSGCARKTPVETIIDNHVEHIDHVLDYSYNNMEQTGDIMLLEGELKSCQMALIDVKESYKTQNDLMESRVNYWRLVALWLFFGLGGMVIMWLRRWLK